MAIVGGGDVVLPGFDYGKGVPTPASSPAIILPNSSVDPQVVASITYGHPIPLFIGGYARIGAENIIFGPYISGGVGSWANSFGNPIPIGERLTPEGDRVVLEIAFDSKVVWTLGGGFVSEAFTFRFYPGTFTQAADPLELLYFPNEPIAYRLQQVIFFEGVSLAPFDNKIPYVAAIIGDTTGGAAATAEINLGTAFERFGRSLYVGYSAEDYEVTGIDDTAPAILCAAMPAIMELLPAAARFYRWDIIRGGKLRVRDLGLVTTPDVVLTPDDIIRGPNPLRFDRAAADTVPRVLKLITPDQDYDYVLVLSMSQRPLAVTVATTAKEESVTLPIVMNSTTRQPLVVYAQFADEHERLSCTFTVSARHLWLEPGDTFSFSGIGPGFPSDIFHIIETETGANFTKQITAETLIRTAVADTALIYLGPWYTTPTIRLTNNAINLGTPCGGAASIFGTEDILHASAILDNGTNLYVLDGNYGKVHKLERDIGSVLATLDIVALNANFRGEGGLAEWATGAAIDANYIYWAGNTSGGILGGSSVPYFAKIHLSDFATVDFMSPLPSFVPAGDHQWYAAGAFLHGGWFYVCAVVSHPSLSSYPTGDPNIMRVNTSDWSTVGGIEVEAVYPSNGLPAKQMMGAVTDGTYGYFGTNPENQNSYEPISILDLSNFSVGGITAFYPTTVNNPTPGLIRPARSWQHLWLDATYLYAMYWDVDWSVEVPPGGPYQHTIIKMRLSDHTAAGSFDVTTVFSEQQFDTAVAMCSDGNHHFILFRAENDDQRAVLVRLPQSLGGPGTYIDLVPCSEEYFSFNSMAVVQP